MLADHLPEHYSAVLEATPPSEDTTAPRTPIFRVRRCYYNVYTWGDNILTYIRKASVHVGIKVWKHCSNIHSNNNNISTMLSQNMIQYYMNITSSRGAKYELQWDIQEWTEQKELTSYKKESREPSNRGWRKDSGRSTVDPLRYHYVIPINRKSTMVQAPRSGHVGSGESEAPQRVIKWVPSGMHKQTHVYL